MTIVRYLKFLEKMWYAPIVWVAITAQLAIEYISGPFRFKPSVDRTNMHFNDPIAGLEHEDLEVNDVRLHTVTTGRSEKPLMLLLHGFPELWSMWEHQLRHFSGDHMVAAIDMRGYGQSSRPADRTDYYTDKLVDDVVGVVQALGHKKCVLVGHDWGGRVAWLVACMHPELVSRLVVIAAPHPTAFHENFTMCQRLHSAYFQLFYAQGLPEFYITHSDVSLIDSSLVAPRNSPAPRRSGAVTHAEIQRLKAWLATPAPPGGISAATAALNYYRAWVDNDTWAPVPAADEAIERKLKVPTLVIRGDSDKYFLTVMYEHLERHVHHCMVPPMLRDCSHWCPQDRPVGVNRLITEFLAAPTPFPENPPLESVAANVEE